MLRAMATAKRLQLSLASVAVALGIAAAGCASSSPPGPVAPAPEVAGDQPTAEPVTEEVPAPEPQADGPLSPPATTEELAAYFQNGFQCRFLAKSGDRVACLYGFLDMGFVTVTLRVYDMQGQELDAIALYDGRSELESSAIREDGFESANALLTTGEFVEASSRPDVEVAMTDDGAAVAVSGAVSGRTDVPPMKQPGPTTALADAVDECCALAPVAHADFPELGRVVAVIERQCRWTTTPKADVPKACVDEAWSEEGAENLREVVVVPVS